MPSAKQKTAIKEKSAARNASHQKFVLQSKLIDSATRIFIEVVRVGGVVLVMYYFAQAVQSLAGKNTFADIGLKILGNVRISETVAWLFGAGGVTYAYKQKKLLKRTHAQMGERIKSLEKRLDPHRTSSHLTHEGETHPEVK